MPGDVAAAVCCGLVNRGVAYANGKLFVGRLDGYLVALDASTGKELWKTRSRLPRGRRITSPPTIVEEPRHHRLCGRRIRHSRCHHGLRPGHRQAGVADLHDPGRRRTGQRNLAVTGGRGARRRRTHGSSARTTRSSTWSTTAPATLRRGRPRARQRTSSDYGKYTNLYSLSTLALDADTGKIVWHYQTTPYDTWDIDGMNEKVLDRPRHRRAKTVRALKTADRNGFFYVLDRKTGEVDIGGALVHVNWAKGARRRRPADRGPEKRPRQDVWAKDICPNFSAARTCIRCPTARRPALVYIPTFNICMDEVGRDVGDTKKGIFYLGTEDSMPASSAQAVTASEFVAWDPSANKKVWGIKEYLPFVGGALSTAGGWCSTATSRAAEGAGRQERRRPVALQTGSGISQGAITYEIAASSTSPWHRGVWSGRRASWARPARNLLLRRSRAARCSCSTCRRIDCGRQRQRAEGGPVVFLPVLQEM